MLGLENGEQNPDVIQGMEGKNNHIHGEIVIYIMLSHTCLISFSSQSGEAEIFLCLCYTKGTEAQN